MLLRALRPLPFLLDDQHITPLSRRSRRPCGVIMRMLVVMVVVVPPAAIIIPIMGVAWPLVSASSRTRGRNTAAAASTALLLRILFIRLRLARGGVTFAKKSLFVKHATALAHLLLRVLFNIVVPRDASTAGRGLLRLLSGGSVNRRFFEEVKIVGLSGTYGRRLTKGQCQHLAWGHGGDRFAAEVVATTARRIVGVAVKHFKRPFLCLLFCFCEILFVLKTEGK